MKRVLLAAMLVWTGCAQPDPRARAAPDYVARLEPLLYENGFLATEVLGAAATIYNDGTGSEAIRRSWVDDIVPLSRHLADQASATSPPVEWSDRHAEIILAWTARADAYQEIQQAVADGDRERWKVARKEADDAKVREEEWFRTMNRELAPIGLVLDQFP